MVDNNICHYDVEVHDFSWLKSIDTSKYKCILASLDNAVYSEIKEKIKSIFPESRLIEFDLMKQLLNYKTTIGKYSYGPICRDHILIKSIGAFCSFSQGVDYVSNHEMRYVSTHPFLYLGKEYQDIECSYNTFFMTHGYFPEVEPKAEMIKKQRRATIGNDVWLGKNVTVTNSANIGNGVIAAAGAVITKDVPDYAIVAGVPARIIRYRYTPEQIEALNKISWWNWTDDEIRERYDDFYLPIEEFIEKYKNTQNE